MANGRGRRGYGGYPGDYGDEDMGYGDRSGPTVRGGGYGQQRGENRYPGGRNTEPAPRPEDRGRSYGDWLGGSDERDYPSQQRSDMYGGYGQQGGYRPGGGDAGGRRGYDPEERDFWDRASDEVSSWFGDEEAERRREMDERLDRSHRGRGPRGYTRSDERIREDVNDRLTDDWALDASDIEVEVGSGEVTLSGEVATRADKRRAEDIAEDVSGVRHVQNNLRVKQRGGPAIGTV